MAERGHEYAVWSDEDSVFPPQRRTNPTNAEISDMYKACFDLIDTDKDGRICAADMKSALYVITYAHAKLRKTLQKKQEYVTLNEFMQITTGFSN